MFQGYKPISARTDNQQLAMDAFNDGMHLIQVGSAGTGKTYLSLALAIGELKAGRAKKLKIVRSAVQGRDQGFMPGTEAEKMAPYEGVYIDMVNELMGRGDAYQIMKQKGIIEFASTSFMRGGTWRDTIVIPDEIQNFNAHEINTLVTRTGPGTRLLVCGDGVQCDLTKEESGIGLLMAVAPHMRRNFAIITMTADDIVRDPFVKDWIVAVERYTDFYKGFN